ncbi:type II secretion system F family protein [Roseiconus lacunae]|uniref:Type II secretion system F family protein n=2 Tax=Roseiconus lacunae TaxID=2605694 RepID=A0ABT7PGG9_9BACT|nr:type II secretion system F family protein [Roseiconus lacunae]MDM4015473.1 type II secretion system F family protein [Roseiconus lacunae]
MTLLLAVTINPIFLTAGAIFAFVTFGTWFVLNRISGDDKPRAEARLDMMRKRRASGATGEGGDASRSKNEALTAYLERAATPLADKVSGNEKEMGQLREKLMNAGFRREAAPVVFKTIQLGTAAFGLFVGSTYGLLADGFGQDMIIKVGGGLIIGFMIPKFALDFLAKKRMERIFLGLPDALDLMVVCVEAGLGMDQALRKVAEEMEKSHKDIAEEFGIANKQLQLGRTRSDVLQALGFRSGVDDLKQLASILIQADKFGSSISAALRVQSDAMRTRRRQIAEEKAAKTAVKMIFPLVLFIFPGIFVVLVGPAGISMYRNMLSQ